MVVGIGIEEAHICRLKHRIKVEQERYQTRLSQVLTFQTTNNEGERYPNPETAKQLKVFSGRGDRACYGEIQICKEKKKNAP